MTIIINPPAFTKAKSYERYKQEILAWKEVTDISSRKQAKAVALSLPEEDETQIRDKVFDQLPLEELKKENGLSLLVTFLINIWQRTTSVTGLKNLPILKMTKGVRGRQFMTL